jgi:hypothetical protein
MSPDSFTRGRTEIWTYECSACGHNVEKTVERGSAGSPPGKPSNEPPGPA